MPGQNQSSLLVTGGGTVSDNINTPISLLDFNKQPFKQMKCIGINTLDLNLSNKDRYNYLVNQLSLDC